MMNDEWWHDEMRKLLAFISKEWEPTPEQIDRMGWCCYCKKKQNDRNECGCLP